MKPHLCLLPTLCLQDVRLPVLLGWGDEERAIPQEIRLDIWIRFPGVPQASQTDDLAGTYCYDTLLQKIKMFLGKKSFRLIEYLCHELYSFLKKELQAELVVKLTKLQLPMSEVKGGVSYTLSDWAMT